MNSCVVLRPNAGVKSRSPQLAIELREQESNAQVSGAFLRRASPGSQGSGLGRGEEGRTSRARFGAAASAKEREIASVREALEEELEAAKTAAESLADDKLAIQTELAKKIEELRSDYVGATTAAETLAEEKLSLRAALEEKEDAFAGARPRSVEEVWNAADEDEDEDEGTRRPRRTFRRTRGSARRPRGSRRFSLPRPPPRPFRATRSAKRVPPRTRAPRRSSRSSPPCSPRTTSVPAGRRSPARLRRLRGCRCPARSSMAARRA